MRDILEGLYDTSDEKGKQKAAWCSFFFYLFLFLSFVISIFASVRCSKNYINKTLFTYKFPMYKDESNFPPGTPVSLDFDGYVQRGAGFGIYRNVTFDNAMHEMKGLKTEVLDGHLLVAAYEGYMTLYYLDGDVVIKDYTLPLPTDKAGRSRTVNHLIKLSNTRLVLGGSNALLPFTIRVTYSGKNIIFDVTPGKEVYLSDIDSNAKFPHLDNLDNTTIAFIFESGFTLKAGTATWTGEGENAKMVLSKISTVDNARYDFHGIAGMSTSKVIVAATGSRHNGTESSDYEPRPIRCKVGTIKSDGSIEFGEWTVRWFTDNTNWFALDNFNSRQALIAYYDETMSNGIVTMALFLDEKQENVRFGGATLAEHGGAAISSQHIAMRILSSSRFGVFFPDASAHGSLIFMMGERTANNDIIRIGSNFVVARKADMHKHGKFYFSIAAMTWNRFTLLDYFVGEDNNFSSLAIGYHLAYPIGITTDRSKKSKYIQFNGVYKFKSGVKLIPGYTYYTNSKGGIVKGRPYGYNHAEFGAFYVDSRETSEVCALHNQIGVAVSEKELLIRTF